MFKLFLVLVPKEAPFSSTIDPQFRLKLGKANNRNPYCTSLRIPFYRYLEDIPYFLCIY